jgi:hypothetical protein
VDQIREVGRALIYGIVGGLVVAIVAVWAGTRDPLILLYFALAAAVVVATGFELIQRLSVGRRQLLQPRYSQDARYRDQQADSGIVQHRVGVRNPNRFSVDRVRIYVKEMAPRPRKDGGYPPVIPSTLPMASGGDPSIGISLGPGREEQWILGYSATGSDGKMYAGGIAVPDQRWRGAPWEFQPDERWRLIYRIVAEGNPDVEFSIVLTAEHGAIHYELEG